MSGVWDTVSRVWEDHAGFVDGQLAGATERMLDAAGVAAGDDVLDLACGPGGAGLAASARVGPGGSVVFADDAPGMIAAAGRRSEGIDHASTVLCGLADVPVDDETFDAVLIRHGLMFADDHAAAVAEAVRVLRPGGRYAAMTWGPRGDNPWLGLILDAVAEELGVPIPPPGVPGPFTLEDAERLRVILEEGGLAGARVEEVSTPMSAESLEDWWELVPQLTGPLAIALGGLEQQVRDSIRERALESGRSAASEGPDGITLAGSVLIASGRRQG